MVVLAVTLVSAITRSRWLPEWLAAAAGALILLATGIIGTSGARAATVSLDTTVGFLAALLVLSEGCRRQQVFQAVGAYLGLASRGRPQRLFSLVFAASTAVTVILGLDPTVVLLTPIALITSARLRAEPKPNAYVCAHLANSASLLLPISNLTNLLAFHASRVGFTRFAAIMLLPWVAALAVEWIVLRRFFAHTLKGSWEQPAARHRHLDLPPATRYALVVLALTLIGFVLSSPLAIAPIWIAVGGATLMAAPSLREAPASALGLVKAAQPNFLVFVLGLGVIVRAAADNGLRSAVVSLLPNGSTLPDLILVALIAALAANLLNNLPATLVLVPVAAAIGLGPLLAVLVGLNIGPNLTYGGSLATLLWRRIVHPGEVRVELREFTSLGLLTVLPALPLCAIGLWLGLKLFA